MKLYRLTFIDISEGIIVRYERTKRSAGQFASAWKRDFPLRKLLKLEPVSIPGIRPVKKDEFIAWLNNEQNHTNRGIETDE